MPGSDLFEMHLDSAADQPKGMPDNFMLFFKFSSVPRNSSAQTVAPAIMKIHHRALRLRNGSLRQHMLLKAKEDRYGYAAIGAEGGFNVKELNTHRYSPGMMQTNIGPEATPLDEYLYGDKLKNNPRSNKPDLTL